MNKSARSMFSHRTPPPGTRLKLGVGVIVKNQAGAILLERRSDCGLWGLPGGRVEVGESVGKAAEREVFEETGLSVRITRLIGVYSEPEERIVQYPDLGDTAHLVDVIVEAEISGGDLRCSQESLDLRFFLVKDLPDEIVPPARLPLQDYREGRTGFLS